jgi:hypothetical protein
MVSQGLQRLTGTSDQTAAWQSILPDYQASQQIAIKVSFNNSEVCNQNTNAIDGLKEPVYALVSGLILAGIQAGDIYIYDAIRALPDRFVDIRLTNLGVNYRDNGSCAFPAGFTRTPENQLLFYPSGGGFVATEYITDCIIDATYLINMPIMKTHPIGGVSLGYKNHFGSIDDPGALHDWIDVVQGTAQDDYNPLVDFYRTTHFGGKTVLTIADCIFSAIEFNQAPQVWSTFNNQLPHSMFFSRDPVAIDCVMHDFVKAEVPSIPNASNRYLELAEQAGQGVFESINPWIEVYSKIDYQYISLT